MEEACALAVDFHGKRSATGRFVVVEPHLGSLTGREGRDDEARRRRKREAFTDTDQWAPLGRPTRRAGRAQLQWIDAASDAVASGLACALVTGPVSKEAIARSGTKGAARFRGHTEHLQARLRAKEVVMAFWTEALTVSLATTHVPISKLPTALTKSRVAAATYWLGSLLHRLRSSAGSKKAVPPKIAVCGLNPHAGEGGLLGDEEARVIAPGIERARARLADDGIVVDVVGPLGAETAYRQAANGNFDGVVAMYHDQATIPMKLLSFGDAVNVSLGLPIVRTSVDHGTGYDRAARHDADPRGMEAAMRLAWRLGGSRGE
jgi:4-hydroxythreonine-4-phosphate dehydrogenase